MMGLGGYALLINKYCSIFLKLPLEVTRDGILVGQSKLDQLHQSGIFNYLGSNFKQVHPDAWVA